MNSDTTNQDLLQLRSLLADRSEFVPHCDLEQGFLNDLHNRIRSEELKMTPWQDFLNRVKYYLEFEMMSNTSLAGAAVAVLLVMAFLSGSADKDSGSEVSKVEPVTETRSILIKSDDSKHFSGEIPAFTEENSDF